MFPMAYGPAPVTAPGGRSAIGHTVICFAMPASSQLPTVLGTSLSTCPPPDAGKRPRWQVHLPAPVTASDTVLVLGPNPESRVMRRPSHCSLTAQIRDTRCE